MSRTWHHNGLALAASVCLHGTAALALLAPWPAPPVKERPPMIVELVSASAPPSPEQAPTTAPAPSPPPKALPVRRRIQPIQRLQPIAPAVTGQAEHAEPSAAQSAAIAPASSGGESGGGGRSGTTSAPPGYSLGAANTPAPDYPWSARRRGIEGRVVIRLEVGADGHPTQVELIHSSGDDALDRAALTTLRNWQLRPAVADGVPVPGRIVVPILFKLT